MILSISENRKDIQNFYMKKWMNPYCFATLFCILFSTVYAQFSHGVSSPHMTYLFLYPLLAGVFVGALFCCFEKTSKDYFWASHLYHTGVIAVILGSLLRGVFDIAKTSSIYQSGLTIAGAVMMICGVIGFALSKIRQCRR